MKINELLAANGIAQQNQLETLRGELAEQKAINDAIMRFIGISVKPTEEGYEVIKEEATEDGMD